MTLPTYPDTRTPVRARTTRCKRIGCGASNLAWFRTGRDGSKPDLPVHPPSWPPEACRMTDQGRWHWHLCAAKPAPGGGFVADIERPHVCQGAPLPETKDTPVTAAPETFVDDEQDHDDAPEPDAAPATEPPAGDLAAMIAAAVSPLIKARATVDEAAVRRIVAEELAGHTRRVETVVTIVRPDGTRDSRDGDHPLFPVLLRYIGAGCNVYTWGAPGGGKSTAAAHAAKALARPFGYISLNPQTTDSRLLGFRDAHGVYQRTPFRDCYENGGVFCIDEMDNASDNLLTTLNGALENGHAAFPDGMVPKHPDFVMVATGNTAGRGGSQNHAGRRPFDAATAERFVYLEWTYDEPFEERLTLTENASAGPWLVWVRLVRAYAGQHHPRLVVSPRASIVGARLLKAGAVADLEQLAEAVMFKGLDRDTRAKILAACPLPAVKTVAA